MARLAALVASAARALHAAGIGAENSRRDAALLARWQLGWTHAHWLAHNVDDAPSKFEAAFGALVSRRAAREPIAYITGEREFYGREFHVTPDVLIPRPETEHVVEAALEWLQAAGYGLQAAGRPELGPGALALGPVIVDVGTGSGCLAITLALACPAANVLGTDISLAALDIARQNAARHGVVDRIAFFRTSLLEDVAAPIDLIVSNPPYVRDVDRESLAPDVREFEPALALFAGADGLDVIRELLPAAARALAPGGSLIMEIGAGQTDDVAALITAAGLTVERVNDDLQGIPRVVVARQTAPSL